MFPTFKRDARGKFNEQIGNSLMVFGENAYLLEDELNEMQWNLINSQSLFLSSMFTSGVIGGFNIVTTSYDNIFYIDSKKDKLLFMIQGKVFQVGANTVSGQPGGLQSQDNRLIIKLNAPPSSGTRTDLVILETWYQSISSSDPIRKFGGESTPQISYNIVDSRIGSETSRRLQLRWRIRVIDGQNDIKNVNAFNYANNDTGIKYQQVRDCYVATLPSPIYNASGDFITDGIIRAIPLFTVNRRAGATIINSNDIVNLTQNSYIDSSNVPQDISANNMNLTGNLVVSGDLIVQGTTTTLNTSELNIEDNIMRLNTGYTGADPNITSGIEIERGSSPNVSILWFENEDKWKLTENGTNYYNILHSGMNSADFLKFAITYNSTENSIDFIIK